MYVYLGVLVGSRQLWDRGNTPPASLCRCFETVGKFLCLEARTSGFSIRTLLISTVLCPMALLQETMLLYTATFSGVGWTWTDMSQRTLVATSEKLESVAFCAFQSAHFEWSCSPSPRVLHVCCATSLLRAVHLISDVESVCQCPTQIVCCNM